MLSQTWGQVHSPITVPAPANEAALSVKVNSDLVQIPVTVTDKEDQAVEHLNKEIFLVYENGVQQTIAHFEPGEAPISACVVFDSSGSMKNKLHNSVEAIHQLLNAAMSDDEYCLVRFSDWPEIMVGITNGSAAVAAAMNGIYPGGWTALGCHLSRHARSQAWPQPSQGNRSHFRWRRQPKSAHAARDYAIGSRSRRSNLFDWNHVATR